MISREIHVKRLYEVFNTDFQITVTSLDIAGDACVKKKVFHEMFPKF